MTQQRSDPDDARAAAFADLFRDAFDDVLRFCARRVPPERAEDVAAETMTIAWRRFDEVPPGRGNQRAWLFTTARNLMLRDGRDDSRRRSLAVRVAPTRVLEVPAVDGEASARVDLGRAWRLLSERHQEALALTVWECLSTLEAAAVLGISPVAYRLRLSRARKALRAHLDSPSTGGLLAARATDLPSPQHTGGHLMTPDLLDRVLTAADPAAAVVARRDPDALLREILRGEPVPSARAPRRRRAGVRVALVAAAVGTVVAIPLFSGTDNAYAGWTAYPAALSTGQSSAVARQCQRWVREDPINHPATWCCRSDAGTSAWPC